ncbi:trypsin domain-containing protein [Phthorimaea operculella]|nr:trypsin domain-containing protein [Phthorimaea operculella]
MLDKIVTGGGFENDIISMFQRETSIEEHLRHGIKTWDSGGPNIHGNTVVGVTAFTPYPCAQGGLATGLARVSSYIDWILDNVVTG